MNTIDVGALRSKIAASQQGDHLFSGAILVTHQGSPVYEEAFGYANRAEALPNRIDTRFQMASGCKIFTAVAICQLVEQGRLTLDTRLRACVGVLVPRFDPGITVRQLLTHTSGITSYFEEDVDPDYEALWRDKPVYRMREVRDFLPLFQTEAQKFEPGTRFEYNDGGYILLGLIVEAASGVSFDTYVTDHVFARAGMTNSGYFFADRLPPRTANAYIKDPDGSWRTNIYAVPIVGGPDGGAYTTAFEMDRFWKALRGDELLSPQMTATMLTPHVRAGGDGRDLHYGYGVWMLLQGDGEWVSYVEGWDPGVAFLSAFHPHHGLAITILGNTNRSVWRIYDDIVGATIAS